MSKNIGISDRILRLILSLLLFLFAWWQASWIVFFVAIFVIYEALAGWCIFFQMLKKNSCGIDKRDAGNKK